MPQRRVALLFYAKAFLVPVAREHRLALKELPEPCVVEPHSFIGSLRHDMQQRFERRARGGNAAVLKIIQRHAALGFHDGVHSRGK